jgi:hypothetical protein
MICARSMPGSPHCRDFSAGGTGNGAAAAVHAVVELFGLVGEWWSRGSVEPCVACDFVGYSCRFSFFKTRCNFAKFRKMHAHFTLLNTCVHHHISVNIFKILVATL